MANPQAIKEQVKNQVSPDKQKAPSFQEQFKNYLGMMAPSIKTVLPKQFDSERFMRIALSEVRKNPQLSKCSIESVAGAVMQSAMLGLEPGLHGHAYLVPRWNGKTKQLEAEFQIGYKGYMDLGHRTGKIAYITAEVVYEDDHFEFEFGSNQRLVHVPNIDSDKYGDPQHAKKYYMFIKFKDASEQFKVMTKKQATKRMADHAPKNKQGAIVGPWQTDFDAMALKTVIRDGFKTVQISTDFQENIARDETITTDPEMTKKSYDVIDMDYEEVENNEEQGE